MLKIIAVTTFVVWLLLGSLPTTLYFQGKLKAQKSEAIENTKKIEKDLNVNKAKADFEKAFAVASASAKLQLTIDSLRNRPVRPPTVASTQPACTGAGLYRDDSEFLARLAERAEQVRIERDYYYGQYEAARRLLAGQEQDAGHNGPAADPKLIP